MPILHANFHLDPSNRLVTVHERHRQTGQDRHTDKQRSDSIGRTVLKKGRPKTVRRVANLQTRHRARHDGVNIEEAPRQYHLLVTA